MPSWTTTAKAAAGKIVEQAKMGPFKLGPIQQYFLWLVTPSYFSPCQHLEDVARSFLVLWLCDLASAECASARNLVEIAQDIASDILTTQPTFILHQ